MRARFAAVEEHAQRLEQVGLALNIVDNHEAGQGRQRLLGRLQTAPICRAFQIEIGDASVLILRHVVLAAQFRERCLAALARPVSATAGCARKDWAMRLTA